MKINKSILITAALTTSLLVSATPVFAVNSLGLNSVINQASKAATRQATTLDNLKSRANILITNRINELNALSSRIQSNSRLSSDDKLSLSTDIQNTISGLNQLNAKIQADTDLTTARADGKQIFTSYRVYEVVIPKTNLLMAIEDLQTVTANVQNLVPQLQNLLSTLQSQGKDTSSLTPVVADINTQLQTISTQLATDKATVQGVTISTTNPQTTFTSVRKDLSGVRSDFAKIRSDVAQLRSDLKIVLTGGNSGQSASPSATAK